MAYGLGNDKYTPESLRQYYDGMTRFKVLKRDEEQILAHAYKKGSTLAGHRLVTANLRFVVRVANEYRGYNLPLEDLIQAGNIGLIKAVGKFDPDRGFRLVSYAVWWIRAYIQNFIMANWSLVKLGTTQAQRKLFFKLKETQRSLAKLHGPEAVHDLEMIASSFGLRPDQVESMIGRMAGDASLNNPIMTEDGPSRETEHIDHLEDSGMLQDEQLIEEDRLCQLRCQFDEVRELLNDKERRIYDKRLRVVDDPHTLQEIGKYFGISRERARQIEGNVKKKIRAFLLAKVRNGEISGDLIFDEDDGLPSELMPATT